MTKGRQPQRSLPRRLSIEEHFSQQFSAVRIYHQAARQPLSMHWHEFYEVHFILAGQGTHLLNEWTHQLVPGTLFLLTPADFHARGQHTNMMLPHETFTEERSSPGKIETQPA